MRQKRVKCTVRKMRCVKPDEVVLVEDASGSVHEVRAVCFEGGIVLKGVGRNAVEGGCLEHAVVQVRVREPLDGLLGILHCSEHNLGVEVVGQLGDELRLDGQLLVHEREVVLQLAVVGQ